ncbi:uncharacterized protein BXZ73DRAFT_108299 [Epithele typhae]|uniref:uncharacterized protein n=1 Tax=Epithele typhae TaxID=378194 RepID=UPI0020077393|nr:uncharacterized protein BXZ73DRAFT_108299 [Epithele typhae]KAH9911017.1 hypothetical protein BXZ73DRAFT_108299 [Epithele typhae]
MHRADMVRVLVRHLPARCTIHGFKRLISYDPPSRSSPNDAHTLHFADGTHATADVLLGADGIKSGVRCAMYAHKHARECDNGDSTPVAYRYLIPTERLREVNPAHHALHVMAPMSVMLWQREAYHHVPDLARVMSELDDTGFVTRPGQEGTEYPHKWVLDANWDGVVRKFAAREPEVDQMIALRLPLFAHSAPIADAHDHSPSRALVEAERSRIRTSDTLLTDPLTDPPRLLRVLEIYQAVRLPFARAIVQNARRVGLMYQFNSPGLYAADPAHGELTVKQS